MESLAQKLFELSAYGRVTITRTGRAVTVRLSPRINEISSRDLCVTELELEVGIDKLLLNARSEIELSVHSEIDEGLGAA
jgi:hypothetical protein